jgi:phosphoribosylamine---glycine ligase
MRVLLLGSGGRESALASALDRSSSVTDVVVAPGNPGVARFATCISINPEDPAKVVALARELKPELVVIGPEAPLVAGVGDSLREEGFDVFGPGRAAARIEGSKLFAKQLMERAGVATASGRAFTAVADAVEYMDTLGPPYVVKADGLAAGKGVVVSEDRDEAIGAIEDRIERGMFGSAGRTVIVEEFLDGPEASLIAVSDGSVVVPLEPAQDYKRADDDDAGPNTGGMGSYSPVPACPPPLADRIVGEIIEPMIAATAKEEAPFVGAIYAGLALTTRGPRVIEFNVRFGDPETQAILPRLESDFGELCLACAKGDLAGTKLDFTTDVCVSVVLASRGYPGGYERGMPIEGVDEAAALQGVRVFQAGTARREDRLVTDGGRVLAVSALGSSFRAARRRAYEAVDLIRFEGKHVRTDIAARAVAAEDPEA